MDMTIIYELINKFPVFALDCNLFLMIGFNMADDLCLNPERRRYFNSAQCRFFRKVEFQPMPHIKDLIHFSPARIAFALYKTEKGRSW